MSEYKEAGIKRRDFRSVKDAPEAPGALRSKKTSKPIIVLSRYKPETWESIKNEWHVSKERRESNNGWTKYATFAKPKDAENAISMWKHDPYWGKQYEFKVIDTREEK